jgi:riboflavin kinase/FMN adenylyltransferase
MTIFRNINDIKRNDSTIISVGTFDGVHYAHRQVIKKVLKLASEHGARSFIVTFDPHPQEVLKNKTPDIKLLNTTPEKLKLFEELGIENVLVIKFTHEFSKTTAREFYENLIYSKIGIRSLVVGYDHGFGRGREGDFQMLKKLGEEFSFSVNRVDEIDINSTIVSSTNIRHFLTEGNVENANSLLGYLYSFEAMVIHGDNIGRELGFPTANLTPLTENKVIPGNGVYAVKVELNGTEYNGMMNIGFRPTVSEDSKRVIEVNILDFSAEIYGNKLAVSFVRRLRDEKKFGSKNELIEQIKIDREQTLKILNI